MLKCQFPEGACGEEGSRPEVQAALWRGRGSIPGLTTRGRTGRCRGGTWPPGGCGPGEKPPLGKVAVHVLELNMQDRQTDTGLPQADGAVWPIPSSCLQTNPEGTSGQLQEERAGVEELCRASQILI